MTKIRRNNGALGLRTHKQEMPTITPNQALLEKVKTKLMNIRMREHAISNFLPLSNLPKTNRVRENGITNAKKFPKLFGFLNTSEANLPEV
jgi:hypothetical protein